MPKQHIRLNDEYSDDNNNNSGELIRNDDGELVRKNKNKRSNNNNKKNGNSSNKSKSKLGRFFRKSNNHNDNHVHNQQPKTVTTETTMTSSTADKKRQQQKKNKPQHDQQTEYYHEAQHHFHKKQQSYEPTNDNRHNHNQVQQQQPHQHNYREQHFNNEPHVSSVLKHDVGPIDSDTLQPILDRLRNERHQERKKRNHKSSHKNTSTNSISADESSTATGTTKNSTRTSNRSFDDNEYPNGASYLAGSSLFNASNILSSSLIIDDLSRMSSRMSNRSGGSGNSDIDTASLVSSTTSGTASSIANQTTSSCGNDTYMTSTSNITSNQNNTTNYVKCILAREFCRTSLPTKLTRKFVVEVSQAEWDTDENRWKYRILVQQRRHQQQHTTPGGGTTTTNLQKTFSYDSNDSSSRNDIPSSLRIGGSTSGAMSMTTAFTWRSLADFVWLENALKAEFHGGLLLPLLSISVGIPLHQTTADCQNTSTGKDKDCEVDSILLKNWLSDVLNNVRGQGELLLQGDKLKSIDILKSEAMEAFLYRNTDPLPNIRNKSNFDHLNKSLLPSTETLDLPWVDSPEKQQESGNDCAPESFVNAIFACSGGAAPLIDTLNAVTGLSESNNDASNNINDRSTSNAEGNSAPPPPYTNHRETNRNNHQYYWQNPHESHHQNHYDHLHQQQQSRNNHQYYWQNPNENPFLMNSFSSRGVVSDSASIRDQDSLVESLTDYPPQPTQQPSTQQQPHQQQCSSSTLAIHSELLEAERDLVLTYRRRSLVSLEKLRVLKEVEEHQVGAAWKRFAISMSNLFAIEKQIEKTRIGGLKERKENMPYRKLSADTVDECLRKLSKQKVDRSLPSLSMLGDMISSYLSDLSAVEPSVVAYNEAIQHLARLDELPPTAFKSNNGSGNAKSNIPDFRNDNWDQISSKLLDLKKHVIGLTYNKSGKTSLRTFVTNLSSTSSSTLSTVDNSTDDGIALALQQKRAFHERVLSNEQMLRESVTDLCRYSTIRISRMSWKYLKLESKQIASLKGAAIRMLTKMNNVASGDQIIATSKRHQTEDDQDDEEELSLVERIVNINNNSKFSNNDTVNTGDETQGKDHLRCRNKALELARKRQGRWDAKVALAVMEAVGVGDAEVRVEETTRDLRQVRKYAITLRENLSRCKEAVEFLSSLLLEEKQQGGQDGRQQEQHRIKDARHEFVVETSKLFSGTCEYKSKRSSPSVSILSRAGIETNDPAGWSTAYNNQHNNFNADELRITQKGRCGALTAGYINRKEYRVGMLLNRLSELFKEYETRVDSIESYVYMQCVCIQLEKHFSQQRTQALSAWEKKTDITTAMAIAKRKHMPALVQELEAKLDKLRPRDVSHTTVKESKEKHLASKAIKTELLDLSNRRYLRAREVATERVVAILSVWTKFIESVTDEELRSVAEIIGEIERTVKQDDIPSYLQKK